jgi:hypothetical protein
MDISSLSSLFSGMQQTQTAAQASVAVAKKALDVMETQGEAALKLMQSASLPRNTGGRTGGIIDVAG